MKFIFPQNYKFTNKILGVFDYSTAIINIVWYIFVYIIINFIFNNLKIKIFVFILLAFPFFLFSVIGFNHENIVDVMKYIIKYFKNRKLYLYK